MSCVAAVQICLIGATVVLMSISRTQGTQGGSPPDNRCADDRRGLIHDLEECCWLTLCIGNIGRDSSLSWGRSQTILVRLYMTLFWSSLPYVNGKVRTMSHCIFCTSMARPEASKHKAPSSHNECSGTHPQRKRDPRHHLPSVYGVFSLADGSCYIPLRLLLEKATVSFGYRSKNRESTTPLVIPINW